MRGGADHRPAADRGRALAAVLSLSLGALALPPSGALAADWSITGNVSERIEADTNRDLDGSPSPVYGSSTRLGLNFTGATPTTEWQILTGVTGSVFGGPGKDESDDDLNRVDPSIAADIAHNGKYLDTGASFFFDMAPASFTQLEETGVTEGDATQLTVQLAADAAYALDPRNRVQLAGYGRIVRFTEGTTTLEPITTYGGTLAWLHDLGPVTQGSLTLGVRRFTSESDTDPESLTSDLSVGINHAVNRRFSFGGSLGISATRSMETIAGQRESDFTIGAVAGLDATWAPEPDTELSFAFSHGLEPSTLGVLQTTTSVGVGLQHVINERVSAGVAVALQRRRAGGGFESGEDRDFVRVSPSIAFQLTPDWALQAGYALTADRESDEGEALSNRVFLTVTREFNVLP